MHLLLATALLKCCHVFVVWCVLVMRRKVSCSLHLLLEQHNIEWYLLMQDSQELHLSPVGACITLLCKCNFPATLIPCWLYDSGCYFGKRRYLRWNMTGPSVCRVHKAISWFLLHGANEINLKHTFNVMFLKAIPSGGHIREQMFRLI
jgi:hypothetical protein